MSKPHPAQEVFDNASSMVVRGDRPGLQRRAAALVGGAALVAAMALLPQPAEAQNYSQLFQGDSVSANQYGRNEALRTSNARLAEVVQVRPVQIQNNNRASFGGAVGAAVGVGAANRVAQGRGSAERNVARALLGGLGGVAGHKTQQRITTQAGYEITLLERGNRLTSLVQAADVQINPGDFVLVSGTGRNTRISPLDPQFQQRLRSEQVYNQQAPRRSPGMGR